MKKDFYKEIPEKTTRSLISKHLSFRKIATEFMKK